MVWGNLARLAVLLEQLLNKTQGNPKTFCQLSLGNLFVSVGIDNLLPQIG
jgi:hypothetical protein